MSGIVKGPAKMATDQSLTMVMMVFFLGGGQVSLNSISILGRPRVTGGGPFFETTEGTSRGCAELR